VKSGLMSMLPRLGVMIVLLESLSALAST